MPIPFDDSLESVVNGGAYCSGLSLDYEEAMSDPTDRMDRIIAVRQVIQALPQEDQRLLSLRFWHGCTQSEIARTLGISQGEIAKRLQAIFARLRPLMEDCRRG